MIEKMPAEILLRVEIHRILFSTEVPSGDYLIDTNTFPLKSVNFQRVVREQPACIHPQYLEHPNTGLIGAFVRSVSKVAIRGKGI